MQWRKASALDLGHLEPSSSPATNSRQWVSLSGPQFFSYRNDEMEGLILKILPRVMVKSMCLESDSGVKSHFRPSVDLSELL